MHTEKQSLDIMHLTISIAKVFSVLISLTVILSVWLAQFRKSELTFLYCNSLAAQMLAMIASSFRKLFRNRP